MSVPDDPASFIWYELMTPDGDAAARFYDAVLGWKIGAHPLAPGGRDYRAIRCSDGGMAGGVLQLTDQMQRGGARPAWLGYLAVRDVDAAVGAIEADGGRTHLPKMSLPVGDIALVSDPLGAPFYVMRPIPPAGEPRARSGVFDPTAAQRVHWNELESPDAARASAFYARHFGFEYTESLARGATGGQWIIEHGSARIGAMTQSPPGSALTGWLFHFGVESVAAAGRAIEAAGGQVETGPRQTPGDDWCVVARDPQGARFGIIGAKGQ